MKKYLILIFTVLAMLFASCSNGLDNVNNVLPFSVQGTVTVTGNLSVSGAFPEEIAGMVSTNSTAAKTEHTAIPGVPGTVYTYVWAEKVGDSAVKYDGNVTGSTYTISIPTGASEVSYKLFAKAYISSSTDSLQLLYAESLPFPISSLNTVVSKNLELQAVASGGTGIISLTVTKTSDSGIASAKATYDEAGTTKTITAAVAGNTLTFTQGAYNADNTAVTGGITSGYYPVTFDFYSGAGCTGELKYSFVQGVNIFDNFITNTWLKNGADPYLTVTEAAGVTTTACQLTKALVDDFTASVFYISQSGTSPGNGANGSLAKPFSDISYAIEKMNNPLKDYKVYANMTLPRMNIKPTAAQEALGQDIQARSITIIGINNLQNNGIPRDAIAGTSTASAVIINTAVPVTFKKIKIQDGNTNNTVNDTNRGGGIDIEKNGAVVNLESDVYICSNYATKDSNSTGGGVYVCSGATLNLKNGAFIGEKQEAASYTGENRAIKGGAIYNAGTVNMYDGATLRYNRVFSSSYDCCGAGIYCAGSSHFNMYGGIIDFCCAGTSSSTHNAWGGGLYLAAGSYCNLYGGEIKNCYSKNPGAAVCYEAATFNMKGTIHIPKGGSNADNHLGHSNIFASVQNDLHNKMGTAINIEGDFTAHSATDKILLTPINYNTSTQILTKGTGVEGPDFKAVLTKIEIVPQETAGDPNLWFVRTDGNMFMPIGSKLFPDAQGDIVYNDGSADPATIAESDLTSDKRSAAIAVICYSSPASKMLVGLALKQIGVYSWAKNTAEGAYTLMGLTDEVYGSKNLTALKSRAGSYYTEANYPAFWQAEHYGTSYLTNYGLYSSGWYLPAKGELNYWKESSEMQIVQDSLTKLGEEIAAPVSTDYVGHWTSTERYASEASFVKFPGSLNSADKSINRIVRPVYDFYNN